MCKLIIEGSLEVKLPTVWTDEAAGRRAVREEKRREEKTREEKKKEDQIRERVRRRKMQVREKVKMAKHCVCHVLWLRRVDK